jgi:Flp pilus assembly protein TadD
MTARSDDSQRASADMPMGQAPTAAPSAIPDDQLDLLCELGTHHLAQAQNDRAFKLFSFLSLMRPLNLRYLRGLAQAHRAAGRHPSALLTYVYLRAIHPGDGQDEVDMADCLLRLRDPAKADALLAQLLQDHDAGRRSPPPKVVQRALGLRALIARSAHAA